MVSYIVDARMSARLEIPQAEHLGSVATVIDTGTSPLSKVDEQVLRTINLLFGKNFHMQRQPKDFVSIGGVGAISIQTSGSVNCPFTFEFQLYHSRVYLVPVISPFLLSHRDMDNFGISYHSLEKRLICTEDGYFEQVIWHENLPHLPLNSPSMLSEAQLMSIHRSLGEAGRDKVIRLLETAEVDHAGSNVRKSLDSIIESCKTCALTLPKPRGLLFSSRYEQTGDFNSSIYVDVMNFPDGNILHVCVQRDRFPSWWFPNKNDCKMCLGSPLRMLASYVFGSIRPNTSMLAQSFQAKSSGIKALKTALLLPRCLLKGAHHWYCGETTWCCKNCVC